MDPANRRRLSFIAMVAKKPKKLCRNGAVGGANFMKANAVGADWQQPASLGLTPTAPGGTSFPHWSSHIFRFAKFPFARFIYSLSSPRCVGVFPVAGPPAPPFFWAYARKLIGFTKAMPLLPCHIKQLEISCEAFKFNLPKFTVNPIVSGQIPSKRLVKRLTANC